MVITDYLAIPAAVFGSGWWKAAFRAMKSTYHLEKRLLKAGEAGRIEFRYFPIHMRLQVLAKVGQIDLDEVPVVPVVGAGGRPGGAGGVGAGRAGGAGAGAGPVAIDGTVAGLGAGVVVRASACVGAGADAIVVAGAGAVIGVVHVDGAGIGAGNPVGADNVAGACVVREPARAPLIPLVGAGGQVEQLNDIPRKVEIDMVRDALTIELWNFTYYVKVQETKVVDIVVITHSYMIYVPSIKKNGESTQHAMLSVVTQANTQTMKSLRSACLDVDQAFAMSNIVAISPADFIHVYTLPRHGFDCLTLMNTLILPSPHVFLSNPICRLTNVAENIVKLMLNKEDVKTESWREVLCTNFATYSSFYTLSALNKAADELGLDRGIGPGIHTFISRFETTMTRVYPTIRITPFPQEDRIRKRTAKSLS
jgi:hypothetical protein